MQHLTIAAMPKGRHGPEADPKWIGEFLSAWETAREAYGRVLQAGADRSDHSLARDPEYRKLLSAGQSLHKLGGAAAVRATTDALTKCYGTASRANLDRLWDGIVPQSPN